MTYCCESYPNCSYCDLKKQGFEIIPRFNLNVYCAKKKDNTDYFVIARNEKQALNMVKNCGVVEMFFYA